MTFYEEQSSSGVYNKNKKDSVSSLSPYIRVLRKENVGGDSTTLGILLFNCMRANDDDEALFLTLDDFAKLFTKEKTILYQVRDPETLKGASNLQLKGEMTLKMTSSHNKPTKGLRVRSSSELSPFLKLVLELETQASAKSDKLQKTLKRHNSTSIFSESGDSSSFSCSESESENEETESVARKEVKASESVVLQTVVFAEKDVMTEETIVLPENEEISAAVEKCDILKTAVMEMNISDMENVSDVITVNIENSQPNNTQTGIFLTKTSQPPEAGIFMPEPKTMTQERNFPWLPLKFQKAKKTPTLPTTTTTTNKIKKALNADQKKRKAELNKLYRAKKKKNADVECKQ